MGNLKVLRAGPLTTIQDLGRTGHRRDGVSLGGALDLQAARVANLLAGNVENAALIEVPLGNASFQFQDARVIAWCGGEFKVQLGSEHVPDGHAIRVESGEQLTIGSADHGCRLWLAISGGIDVPLILGSRSTDLRAGFGGLEGRGLRTGDELALGKLVSLSTNARISSWSAPREWSRTTLAHPILRLVRGAEWEEFTDANRTAFFDNAFTVSPQCDRMGARLEGVVLERNQPNERLSEPVAPGTIQVPNDGAPIILLGDCQTIGGYPKIAHVITVDLPFAAQLCPNDSVHFREVSLAEAAALFRARERDLERFRVGLQLRWQ
jgi:antagonist of KipI